MFEVSCTSPVIKRVFQCQLSSPPIYKDCVNCVCPGQVKSYQGGVRLDNQELHSFCAPGRRTKYFELLVLLFSKVC